MDRKQTLALSIADLPAEAGSFAAGRRYVVAAVCDRRIIFSDLKCDGHRPPLQLDSSPAQCDERQVNLEL